MGLIANLMDLIANLSLGLKCYLPWFFTSKKRHRRPTSPSPPQSQHGPPQRRSAYPSSPPRPPTRRPISPPSPSPPPSPSLPRPPLDQPTFPPPRVPVIPQLSSSQPLTEESIWKRLHEAGFDEDSVKQRDKAALIAYIAILESEIYKYQQVALLRADILAIDKEKVDPYESDYRQELLKLSTAFSDARTKEERLKRALAIQKKREADIREALNDMRAVNAETKVANESKLAEARAVAESSQKKFEEAEHKLQKAESMHVEAKQFNDIASRTLADVIARHADLRSWFESECERKENEIETQRQSVFDGQKVLCQGQERLLEDQRLLRQNEEYILQRSEELSHLKKEMETAKLKLEDEWQVFKEEKSDLEEDKATLQTREEAVFKREVLLERREHEVLQLQEKLNKEYGEIQKLREKNQEAFEKKKKELEAEVKPRCLCGEDKIIDKRIIREVKVPEGVPEDGETMGKSLKDERICIELEMLRKNVESLSCECEDFMSMMAPGPSDLFTKTKEERENLARDLMIDRIELENGMNKLSDDIETFRREKQNPFEQEWMREMEMFAMDMEKITSQLRGLEGEKTEITLDCERRERDWATMKISSQSLDIEWQMLQKQWDLMHGNWKEFFKKV